MKFTGERCIIGKSRILIEKEHLDRYNFALDYVKNKIVLDIACGSGYGSKLLSNKAKSVIGVDISKESINYAKNNFNSKNLKFKHGNATSLSFIKDNSIDIVISFETIEHIKEYNLFLSEIKRVLKKEGLFIVSTPNKRISSPYRKIPKNPFHVIEFYKIEFENLLKKYFELVDIYGQEPKTFLIKNKNILSKLYFILTYKKRYKFFYEAYLSKNLKPINKDDVDNCLFLIAICRK